MKKILKFIKRYHKEIFRGSLFLFSIIVILLLFPREGKFRYEFQKGSPWQHETYIAPFDFPIYKTNKELLIEKDSILKEFKPYFKYDNRVYAKQLELFKKKFDGNWDEYLKKYYRFDNSEVELNNNASLLQARQRNSYLEFSINILDNIYTKGVIIIPEIFSKINFQEFSFVIVKDNIAEEFSTYEIFTQESAIIYINQEIENQFDNNIAIDFLKGLHIGDFIFSNLFYDEETSEIVKKQLVEDISLTKGMVQNGEMIISKGVVVDSKKIVILESLKKEYESRLGKSTDYYLILLGHIILVFVSILILFLFLDNFRKDILQNTLKTSFILILILLFVFIASATIKNNIVSLYLVPFAILPIIIRTFYDTRLALFIHLVTILIIGFLAPNPFEFVFLQLIVGIIAIFSLASVRSRGQLFFSAFIIFIAYSIVYFGIAIIQEGNIKSIEWKNFIWFAGNGMLLLMSYPLIYIFEKVFGFLSDVTLMELSDTNNPLLRMLAEQAPGTFQHSLQVANLAEDVVRHIGGNSLLVRTGALYHDIGKIKMPQYFVENQSHGINLHDKIEFDKSAEIIINHVKMGEELAHKYKLPSQVTDFIITHHGLSKVHYFYRMFLKKYPDKEVDIESFTYPGPLPFSKETAILMMADAVEASSRSLKLITEESINELVDNIIDFQINENQFINADITFKDITIAKDVFKRKLMNIYHARIEYPQE